MEVAMVSFTGKAVARLKEVIGNNSPSTMHMMIKNKHQMVKFDYLIIDEVSMITYKLMYKFFEAFGIDYKIILVGDQNQLPPIGWGNFFTELMKTEKIPTARLTKNHRSNNNNSKSKNGIYINSQKIIRYVQKKRDLLDPTEFVVPVEFEPYDNFVMIPSSHRESSINVIIECVKNLRQCGIGAHDITVISPFTNDLPEINKLCQKVFDVASPEEKKKDRVVVEGTTWRIGDRVMMTENNYDIDVMNGDEGTIVKVTLPKISEKTGKKIWGKVQVKFKSCKSATFTAVKENLDDETDVDKLNSDILEGENYVKMRKNNTIACLVHAHAISIHRSQGSEWDCVIFYFPHREKKDYGLAKFLNYHLIYTGFTRAKKVMFVTGDIGTMTQASMNYPGLRHDNFCDRFKELLLDTA
jgi:ATP-dependent exoDNAse (exonuclease V) alpha subunit